MRSAATTPSRVWLVTHAKGLVVSSAASPLLSEPDVLALGLDPSGGHSVGPLGGSTAWVHTLTAERAPTPFAVTGLRALHGTVADEVFAAATRALQVATFMDTHRFCGRCATPTEPVAGERCLRCPACELSVYPRLTPAIIVLVRRGDRALLAHNPAFPSAFYSTLAGFVEVGETLEETIAREVREEVGIEVGSIRYFGSQPWPFPHQLMIGFTAEWTSGDIRVDGVEISDARWFSADELPRVPPPLSIARQLIDAWVRDVSGPTR